MKASYILYVYLMSMMAFLGCDMEDECDDGGVCGDGGVYDDENEEGEETLESFQYLMILDQSQQENSAGTPGVDICGVWADCEGLEISGNARLDTDDRGICSSGDSSCAADRGNARAAEDDGRACSGNSSPSDYVSLGMGGILTLDFGQDLRGCMVHLVELDGREEEGAQVLICSNPADDQTCHLIGEFETNGAGDGGGDEMAFNVSI